MSESSGVKAEAKAAEAAKSAPGSGTLSVAQLRFAFGPLRERLETAPPTRTTIPDPLGVRLSEPVRLNTSTVVGASAFWVTETVSMPVVCGKPQLVAACPVKTKLFIMVPPVVSGAPRDRMVPLPPTLPVTTPVRS